MAIGVSKADDGEPSVGELLQRLYEAHTTGRLGEALLGKGIGRGAVASCAVREESETIKARPSLTELARTAQVQVASTTIALKELALDKPRRQTHVRAWERVALPARLLAPRCLLVRTTPHLR